MADLFAPTKNYRPRRTILSADMNAELAAMVAAFNNLGQAPAAGRTGVSTPFSVANATENYHAINKGQFDVAVAGSTAEVILDANYTVTDAVPVDILMRGRTDNRTITLCQNPSNGQVVRVRDGDNNAATNLITLLRNTRDVNGVTDDLVINLDGVIVTLMYDLANTNWVVIDVSSRTIT